MRVEQTSASLEVSKKKEQELLDRLAGLAMRSFMDRKEFKSHSGVINMEQTARMSYNMARAMIKARKEGNNG